jgi:Fic family protein
MRELIKMWDRCLLEKWVHPLIAVAGFNFDFLCIHPFRDGNGLSIASNPFTPVLPPWI